MGSKIISDGDHCCVTDELSFSETHLAGDPKQKSDLSRFNSFASHSYGDTPLFSGASHMNDCTRHEDLKLNRTRNGPYASKQVLSKGNSSLLMRVSFSLLVCEELLKGIVYPLAVNATTCIYFTRKIALLSRAS